jgi:hypothetical protein
MPECFESLYVYLEKKSLYVPTFGREQKNKALSSVTVCQILLGNFCGVPTFLKKYAK